MCTFLPKGRGFQLLFIALGTFVPLSSCLCTISNTVKKAYFEWNKLLMKMNRTENRTLSAKTGKSTRTICHMNQVRRPLISRNDTYFNLELNAFCLVYFNVSCILMGEDGPCAHFAFGLDLDMEDVFQVGGKITLPPLLR